MYRESNMVRFVRRLLVVMLCVSLSPVVSMTQVDSSGAKAENGAAQEAPPRLSTSDSTGISTAKVAIIGGTVIGAMAGIVIYQANGYWKDNRASFHFREDLKYSLQVDKIAHFWDTALLSSILSLSFEWANMSREKAVFWGAGSSLLFNTFTEVQDGFSEWGFDRVDWLANVGGAFWYVGKNTVPFMDHLDIKWNYYPSPNLETPGAFQGQRHLIFDDYEGFTFWMSLKVNSILPGSVEKYWPDFLCLAVGYGARDILKPDKYSVWYIGLDYDMTKIIPQDTWFLRSLSEMLNYIHFPAPAIRVSPGAIWYGLYIGQ